MAETVRLVPPGEVSPNPENPRLIFHQDELDALQESIQIQGILVPLTVYQDAAIFHILDGERRWRCALKLGLQTVPVILQPKPDRMTNLMMMFAIHHRRDEWDPLPTAFKLRVLEELYIERYERKPTETQLAELASLKRGEVRRYKQLLQLPQRYLDELIEELQKPRSKQILSVDHVYEATRAGTALRRRDILINDEQEEDFRQAIISKYRSRVITNTVEPRMLLKLAQGVERDEITLNEARAVVKDLVEDPNFTIAMAFSQTVEEVDFQHNFEQLVGRLSHWVNQYRVRQYKPPADVINSLKELRRQIEQILEA